MAPFALGTLGNIAIFVRILQVGGGWGTVGAVMFLLPVSVALSAAVGAAIDSFLIPRGTGARTGEFMGRIMPVCIAVSAANAVLGLCAAALADHIHPGSGC
jgi:hypothetical protein